MTNEARSRRIEMASMIGLPATSPVELTEEERAERLKLSVQGYMNSLKPPEESSPEIKRIAEQWERRRPCPPCIPLQAISVDYRFPKMDPLPPGYIEEVVQRFKDAIVEFLEVLDATDVPDFDHLVLEAARIEFIQQLRIPSACRFIDPLLVDCGVEEFCQPLRDIEVGD